MFVCRAEEIERRVRDCTLLGGRVNEARNAHSVDKMTTDYECHSPLTHPHSVLSPSSAGGPFNDLFDNTPLPSFARLSPNFSLHHRSFPSQSQRRRRMVTAPPTFGPNCLRLPGDGRAGGRDADGGRFLFSPPLPDRPTDRTTDRRCRHRHCLRRRRRGRRGTCEQCCLSLRA